MNPHAYSPQNPIRKPRFNVPPELQDESFVLEKYYRLDAPRKIVVHRPEGRDLPTFDLIDSDNSATVLRFLEKEQRLSSVIQEYRIAGELIPPGSRACLVVFMLTGGWKDPAKSLRAFLKFHRDKKSPGSKGYQKEALYQLETLIHVRVEQK